MQLTKLLLSLSFATLGSAVPVLNPRACPTDPFGAFTCYGAFSTVRGRCEDAESTLSDLVECVPDGLRDGVSLSNDSAVLTLRVLTTSLIGLRMRGMWAGEEC